MLQTLESMFCTLPLYAMSHNGSVGKLFYLFEEVKMLAEHIRNLFTNMPLTLNLSKKGIIAAGQRHQPTTTLQQMIKIYRSITE